MDLSKLLIGFSALGAGILAYFATRKTAPQVSTFQIELTNGQASSEFINQIQAPARLEITKTPTVQTAKPLLDLIGQKESNGNYNIIYGGAVKDLTSMSVGEVLQFQIDWRNAGTKSSAVGKYQFIYKTLNGLINDLKISKNDRFNEQLQDELAYELLKRRGYEAYAKGQMTENQFMINIAKEWASFPVPIRTKGQQRTVSAGQSFYAGDGLNKALISVSEVKNKLQQVRVA